MKLQKPTHTYKHICNSHKPTRKPKIAKELASFQPEKNFNFFSPTLKEKIKTPHTQATTMQTDKINFTADRHYTARTDRRAAGNSGFKKLAVQCLNEVPFFNQTFVQVDSLVHQTRASLRRRSMCVGNLCHIRFLCF